MSRSYYAEPKEHQHLSFGDILKAVYLHDIHLQADAVRMGQYALKRDQGIAYSPAFATAQSDFVLGHGGRHDAILVSDNCAIDDALGIDRGRAPQGRLLFAPISRQPEEVIERLMESPPLDRFALPPSSGFTGGVVELRRMFMVDARIVKTEARFWALSDDYAEKLAINIAAYTTRHGPLAALYSVDRLAKLIAGNDKPDPSVRTAVLRVAQVVADSWTLEAQELDAVAEISSPAEKTEEVLSAIVDRLRHLADAASTAANALEAVRS